MSKFENFSVTNGNNQFGDNNTQNNTTNHHHNNNHQNSNGDEILPIAIGALAGVAALIWWFFNHIDQVYYYLNILILTSVCFSLIAILILIFNSGVAKEDLFRFFGSIAFALGLFGLAMLSRNHAPNEIIQLSQQVKFMDFWERLSDHGKDMVVANFTSAIVIGISTLFAHLASVRQFAYSLANPNRVGFWYSTYTRCVHLKCVLLPRLSQFLAA